MQRLRGWCRFGLMLGIVAAGVGCGGSRDIIELCQDACEESDAKGCPPTGGVARCKENCETVGKRLQRLADKGNCGSQFEAARECGEDNFDRSICSAVDPCQAEGESLAGCILTYCRNNPTDADCGG